MEHSKVKECGEHGIEFLELTGLSLYHVNQCLCSVPKKNCLVMEEKPHETMEINGFVSEELAWVKHEGLSLEP